MQGILYVVTIILLMKHFYGMPNEITALEKRGHRVRQQQFPFFVQLLIGTNTYANYKVVPNRCGGSLIHRSWVLTAAQCFKQKTMVPSIMFNRDYVQAFMGSIKSAVSFNSIYHECRNISQAFIHPNYEYKEMTMHRPSVSTKNNIALAALKTPFQLTPFISTIKLPLPQTPVCSEGTVIAAAIVAPFKEVPDALYFAKVYPKPLYQLSIKPMVKTNTTFYTETEYLLSYPIKGDLGGPYVCLTTWGAKKITQHGIISIYYNGDNTHHRPTLIGIYEKVENHLQFIKKYLTPYIYRVVERDKKQIPKINKSNDSFAKEKEKKKLEEEENISEPEVEVIFSGDNMGLQAQIKAASVIKKASSVLLSIVSVRCIL